MAKDEFCFRSTPLHAKMRSEDIASLAAHLLQKQPNENYSIDTLFNEARQIIDEQRID